MTEQDKKYLSDILQAIELIESFTSGIKDFENYLSDLKTQSAVERQLGIIGEAVNKYENLLPDSPILNARKIVGFRKMNGLCNFRRTVSHICRIDTLEESP